MAIKRIVWSNGAIADLYKILEYFISRNGNANYSIKIKNRINHTITLLKTNNYLGRVTNNLSIRYFVELDYLIFYEINNEKITILMVWDTRNNPDKLKYK